MKSTRTNPPVNLISMLPLILQVLLSSISYNTAQPGFYSRVCQDTFGNYSSHSNFARNLDKLFRSIASNTQVDYGFYNLSVGDGLDRVNGIALCRPDLPIAVCKSCLNSGAERIVIECPTQKDAIGWHSECMIRYSDRYIFGKLEFGPWYQVEVNITGVDSKVFNQTVSNMLARLQKNASTSHDSRYKFAAEKVSLTNSLNMYGLAQCTPDLEESDCYHCLDQAIQFSISKFEGSQNQVSHTSRLFYTSCNIRVETFPFYDEVSLRSLEFALQNPSPPSSTSPKGRRSKKSKIVVVLLPICTALALLTILFMYWCFRRVKRTEALEKVEIGGKIRTPESLRLDFAVVKAATSNFSEANKLGQGGFGAVYKGKLPGGQVVAVKRLSQRAEQGEEEFKNEVVLVARLQHRNLVRFLGFSLEDEERLLIYELLPNKSLDYFLFDPIKRAHHLDWQTRYKIIEGIARGLLYLHEDSRLLIVHRDLKAGNILLDANMNPKIADFGMAKLVGADDTHGHASKICGTYGYMPPEYIQGGQFSFKSDVYSFGVLLLEIITGLRITAFYNTEANDNLLSYAWKNWLEGTALNVVDSTMSIVNTEEVLKCINIGLLCVQENVVHRPVMSSVVLMLNGNTIALPVPSRPAFLLLSEPEFGPNGAQSNQVDDDSPNYISISEFDPR